MNYKSFISLALLLAFGTITGQISFIKPLLLPQLLTSQHSQKLHEERTGIHQTALAEIKKEFNIADDTWKRYMDHIYTVVQKDDLFDTTVLVMQNDSNHWLIQEAKKVLIECGVNLARIEIKLDTDPKKNGAADQWYEDATGRIKHTLILNPDWFAMHSLDEREAVLRHEIMHLAHYDGIEEGYICGLIAKVMGYTQEQIDASPAIVNYRKQRELRADLMGVVDKPLLVQSEYNRFSNYAKFTSSFPENFWKTHPDNKTRAESMAQLFGFINQPALA